MCVLFESVRTQIYLDTREQNILMSHSVALSKQTDFIFCILLFSCVCNFFTLHSVTGYSFYFLFVVSSFRFFDCVFHYFSFLLYSVF